MKNWLIFSWIRRKLVDSGQEGYITLLFVLIVGAATLTIALTLLSLGTDRQRETAIEQQSVQARALAASCADEGLQQIHDNTNFSGTNNLSLGAGSCTYSVVIATASTRTMSTTGTVGNVVRKINTSVTINASSISITSWQEVS